MIQSSAHRLAIPAKFDGEPEEKLNHRHHADPKAKSNSERKFFFSSIYIYGVKIFVQWASCRW